MTDTIRLYAPDVVYTDRPAALYLPGLDGVGDYSSKSLRNLKDHYNLYQMRITPEDRTTFIDVSQTVISYVNDVSSASNGRVLLIGESFGGLLASYVSIRAKDKLSGMVLINPATSYDKTAWGIAGPIVAGSGPLYPLVGMSTLLATAVEPQQIVRGVQEVLEKVDSPQGLVNELTELYGVGQKIVDLLSPETLDWRLTEYLKAGTFVMDSQYSRIKVPTLVLSGTQDRLLPSRDEGRRLQREMTSTTEVELVEFKRGGHALLDGSIDLYKIIRQSRTFADAVKALDPKTDFQPLVPHNKEEQQQQERNKKDAKRGTNPLYVPLPNQKDLDKVDAQFGTFIKGLSPIFLAKDHDGQLTRGIADVPVGAGAGGRPVLLVGNHQLYGADLSMIIREFIHEKKTLVRGLAHPVIFRGGIGGDDGGGASSGRGTRSTVSSGDDIDPPMEDMRDLFTKFGAVEVGPGSIYSLMQSGETVLLFPGGVREAYHGKGEEYKLFWSNTTDFVRMAGLFDAIIVPFAAIGIADSVEIVLGPDELSSMPIIGRRVRDNVKNTPNARMGGVIDSFVAPLAIPKAPSRCYFLFQEPIDTKELNIYDKEASARCYRKVQQSVESGITELLRFRENDPYSDFLPRLGYELLNRKQAPTSPTPSK